MLSLRVFPTVRSVTEFTVVMVSVCFTSVFVKVRNWFNLLASTASFCYDWFRHARLLLISDYCLELVAAHTVSSSFYYTGKPRKDNNKMKNNLYFWEVVL